MEIKDYTQTNHESCLPILLLLLSGKGSTPKEELNLVMRGLQATRKSYALGMVHAFVEKYNKSAVIYVDNKYFLGILKRENQRMKSRRIKLIHKRVNNSTINGENPPFIVYVDHQLLGVYSHVPHFVAVTKKLGKNFYIFDPWTGKNKKVSGTLLTKAVNNLRNYIKYCPLLIKLI